MPDLAVVIVTWNVRDLIVPAISSLLTDLTASALDAVVHVIDCASHDGTPALIAERFPEVNLYASPDNLGFAGGNNLGLRRAGFGMDAEKLHDAPRAVYLLNPDTITELGATRYLFEALFAQPDIGLVGAQLRYGDGSFQHGAFGFPGLEQLWVELFPTPGRLIEGRFNGRYDRSLYAQDQPFAVDFVLGATMMLRREVIDLTRGFDPQFFMYCEEVDWAWRIHNQGFRSLCVPAAHVVHLGGQSTGQVRPRSLINLWTSRLKLFKKHYPAWKFALARFMIVIGMMRLAEKTHDVEVKSAYQTIRQLAMTHVAMFEEMN